MEANSVSNETYQAIAREAAAEIHWHHVKKPDAYEQEDAARTTKIILAAIEKAQSELLTELGGKQYIPAAQPQRSDIDYGARVIELFGSWLDHWSIRVNKKTHEVYGAWDECRELARKETSEQPPATDDRVKEKEWTPEYVDNLLGQIIAHGVVKVADAHNTALAAEREKLEQARKDLAIARPLAGKMFNENHELRQQLLAAQAAIAQMQKFFERVLNGLTKDKREWLDMINMKVDLSALDKHDSEVRKPLVDALEQFTSLRASIAINCPNEAAREIWMKLCDEADALSKVKEGESIPDARTDPASA